jgi:hypothetical protein
MSPNVVGLYAVMFDKKRNFLIRAGWIGLLEVINAGGSKLRVSEDTAPPSIRLRNVIRPNSHQNPYKDIVVQHE